MKVKQVYDYLDSIAPFLTACDFDNCGLIIGDMNAQVKKIGLALDITNDVCDKAVSMGINLIISHHPVIFNPMKNIQTNSPVYKLIQNNISTIAMHTNLDKAMGGVNDTLVDYYALKDVYSPESLDDLGRVGEIKEEISIKDYALKIKNNLNSKSVKYYDAGKKVKKVCFVSGGGGSMIKNVLELGVDTFITGDIKHDQYIDAVNNGINIIEANHFDSEIVVLNPLKEKLSTLDSTVEIEILQSNNYVNIV